MKFDTFIPEIEEFDESLVVSGRPDSTSMPEHPDERAQRLRHSDDRHQQELKHRDDTHDQNHRHREEAHKHNLKKAHDNDFAYAPAVYAYSGPTTHACFTTAGESPNAGAGTSGTTSDTPSASGGGGAGGGGAGAGGGAA